MNRKRATLYFGIFTAISVSSITFFGAAQAWAQGPFHVEAKWKVGGDGRWDYLAVDPASKLLYVTRQDHVMVINTESGKVVADMGGLHGVHGVAFDTSGQFGYISDGTANQVAVFDRKTNRILKAVPAGTNPDGIAFEPVTQTVWAFNGRSNDATVIDDKSQGAIVATVKLPGKPEFPVADGKGSIFANIEDKSEIVHIDAKTHAVVGTWPLAPCEGPSGLAIDRMHDRLFSVCDGKKMAIVNTVTGKVVAAPTIGDGPDAAAYSPQDKYVFSSNGDGTLTVIRQDSPDKYTVVQNLLTQKGARTMALDPDGKRVYLVTADFGPAPAPTAATPRPRPSMIPGSFVILVAGE